MNYEKEFITIGRKKSCEVVMKDKSISKFHCNLKIRKDCVDIYDLNSKSGVFVKLISKKIPLINETALTLVINKVMVAFEPTRGWFLSPFNCCFNLFNAPFYSPLDYSCYSAGLIKEKEVTAEIKVGGEISVLNKGDFKNEKNSLDNPLGEVYRQQNNTFVGIMESIENNHRHNLLHNTSRIIEIPGEEDEEDI